MNTDIQKIPAWILALSIGVLVAFIFLLLVTGKQFCYVDGLRFVDKGEQCAVKSEGNLQPIHFGRVEHNDKKQPKLIFGYCNQNTQLQTIEGYSGEQSVMKNIPLVVTEDGSNKMSITFIVPPGYYYYVKKSGHASCIFNSWDF
jgi:hypothetical protein